MLSAAVWSFDGSTPWLGCLLKYLKYIWLPLSDTSSILHPVLIIPWSVKSISNFQKVSCLEGFWALGTDSGVMKTSFKIASKFWDTAGNNSASLQWRFERIVLLSTKKPVKCVQYFEPSLRESQIQIFTLEGSKHCGKYSAIVMPLCCWFIERSLEHLKFYKSQCCVCWNCWCLWVFSVIVCHVPLQGFLVQQR